MVFLMYEAIIYQDVSIKITSINDLEALNQMVVSSSSQLAQKHRANVKAFQVDKF